MKNKTFKVGEKYTIQFYDHCLEEEKILCEVTINPDVKRQKQ